jgi:hypothetical protein
MDYYRSMMQTGHNLSGGADALIPIGVHNPWNDYVRNRINEEYRPQQCPYKTKVVENSKYGRRFINKRIPQVDKMQN